MLFASASLLIAGLHEARAGSQLRLGPVEGVSDSWRPLAAEAVLPAGRAVQVEISWGLNLADTNADGRVDLSDYGRLALCFSGEGGGRPNACSPEDFRACDLDGDGDVDDRDGLVMGEARRTLQPYVVERVDWHGAHEVRRTPYSSCAEVGLSRVGNQLVAVQVRLFDPTTQRRVSLVRHANIRVLNLPPGELARASDDAGGTPLAAGNPPGLPPMIEVSVSARSNNPNGPTRVAPGDLIHFQLGIRVRQCDEQHEANRGLAFIVYDVLSPEAAANGYFLNPMADAESGYTNFNPEPVLHTVDTPMYRASQAAEQAFYHGGWGFDTGGLEHGGDVTWAPGAVINAGLMAPLCWIADNNPDYPGLQPLARLEVGQGTYIFPADDPVLGGLEGGFGQELADPDNIVTGDGTWVFQESVIDTTGWAPQAYSFEVIPAAGHVFDIAYDYTQDVDGGFRVNIQPPDLRGDGFRFDLALGFMDCNANGQDDALDVAHGVSGDCNDNGVPDDCEPDSDADGVPDGCDECTDTDGDGYGDAHFLNNTCPQDECPCDPGKIAPGICGCGVPDIDSDADGALDCLEECPFDPDKTEPGECGCGVPDEDLNGDGVLDCIDLCPDDPDKTAPGVCGCGVPDTDVDFDGAPDCLDGCPFDPNKAEPGICGCGISDDVDVNGDGIPDCGDQCPDDPDKMEPGICGCGVPDTDTDYDGAPDCIDACPNDWYKTDPGLCGCGVPDIDNDDDGVPNCLDQCPNDPLKIEPGVCGCGFLDTDNDGDGTPNCIDRCPQDPDKTEPGQCGCGVPDTDSNGDGIPDCQDDCPDDPDKTQPGICGCGIPDVDSDNDGTLDCHDGCPYDALKTEPGICGCGNADADTDGDATLDCLDQCPLDDNKLHPGICGCGVPDVDQDEDGYPWCQDACPFDPYKAEPGLCGCGHDDTDSDEDYMPDCHDRCPYDPEKIFPGVCGCGTPDTDSDGDGIPDCIQTLRAKSPGSDGQSSGGTSTLASPGCGATSTGLLSISMLGYGLLLTARRRCQ